MTVRKLNIKNRTYYFCNDLINILNFESIDLKLDKKTWKDIDIYYIVSYIILLILLIIVIVVSY